jgi:hypothetical protein
MTTVFPPIIRAIGKPEVEFKAELILVIIMLPVIYGGSFYGIEGVAIAITIVSIIYYILVVLFVQASLSLSVTNQVAINFKPLIYSVIMFFVLTLFKYLADAVLNLTSIWIFIFTVSIGGCLYLILMYLFSGNEILMFKEMLRKK